MNNRLALTAVLVAISIVAASGQARDRTRRPDAGSSQSLTPVILKRQLSNGLPVWIV
jgi:hypothetical protein